MHRIDAPDFAPGNLFTEGSPSPLIPATVVGADWLNDMQESQCRLVEAAGITLVKGDYTQVIAAIQYMISTGGGLGAGISQAIVNNQASALDVTGLIFDPATYRGGKFFYYLERRTDTSNEVEQGECQVAYNPETSTFQISQMSQFDDCGVVFEIDDVTGQVAYTSDNLPGASYAGTMRIIDIRKVLITIP